jgi:hypothetical protein
MRELAESDSEDLALHIKSRWKPAHSCKGSRTGRTGLYAAQDDQLSDNDGRDNARFRPGSPIITRSTGIPEYR